jgi:CO/xanthine dehydrogenase FAD-binding subunit
MRQVFLPENLDQLWDMLDHHPDAAIYAGGTDLLVQIRAGTAKPGVLICLERLEELKRIEISDDTIYIGAATPHTRIIESPIIRGDLAVLREALSRLGSPPIRNAGTIGGNIVNASPAADSLPPLYLLDALLELASRNQTRIVPIKEFITGPGATDLRPGEILSRILVKKPSGYDIHHFEKVGRRKSQACSIASFAAMLKLSNSGIIERAAFAWGSVGPVIVTSDEINRAVVGKRLERQTLALISEQVKSIVDPISDVRAGAEYRRAVAAALLVRLAVYGTGK